MGDFLIGCAIGFVLWVLMIVGYGIVYHLTEYTISSWTLLVIPITGLVFEAWVAP